MAEPLQDGYRSDHAAVAAPVSVLAGGSRARPAKPGQYIHALKNVTFNEPFFHGTFPAPAGHARRHDHRGAGADRRASWRSRPSTWCPNSDTRFYFVAIDNARFRKPVEPGDQLILKVTLKRSLQGNLEISLPGARSTAPKWPRPKSWWRPRPREPAAAGRGRMIDARAVVSPQAEIAADVEIGPFSIIGPDVVDRRPAPGSDRMS